MLFPRQINVCSNFTSPNPSAYNVIVNNLLLDVLVSGGRDGTLNLWDLRATEGSAEQKPVSTVLGAHQSLKQNPRRRGSSSLPPSVTCAQFGADEFTLYTGGVDGYVQNSLISCFVFANLRLTMCCAEHRCVKVWDTRAMSASRRKAPAPVFTIECGSQNISQSGVASLDISKDGTRLLASLTSSQLFVYNLQHPTCQETGSYYGHLNTHSFYVKSCFSPDDNMFLSGSSDGRLYIWEVDRPGAPVIQLSCHRGEVNNVDWCNADPLKLASSSDDGYVRLWR